MTNLFEAKIHDFLKLNDRVLIAVSGGADSIALLHLLNEVKHKYKLSLFVAHLNHKLRGKQSDRDAEFVKTEAEKMGITCISKTVEIKENAKTLSGGLEKVARDARYSFFIETAAAYGLNKIALAHTNDDNIETMLFRFIKGAGVYGLRGIAPVRKIGYGDFNSTVAILKTTKGLSIIRPLIYISKKAIYAYLKTHKFKFNLDKSNNENIYDRNKLRNDLIPSIEKTFNPAFKNTLSNTCEIISAEDDYINSIVVKNKKKLLTKVSGGVKIALGIKTLHKALRLRIIMRVLSELLVHKRKISHAMITELDDKIQAGRQTTIALPEDNVLKITEAGILILKTAKISEVYEEKVIKNFLKRTEIMLYSKKITFEKLTKKNKIDFSNPHNAYLDLSNVRFPLKARGTKEGDKFIPYGTDKECRLKNFIKTAKLERPIVILEDREKILWLAGSRVDNRAKISSHTKMILKVSISL
ncbi:MAG: tRNA lysidine(34) synthetase TilS [bacterium]